MEKFCIDCKGGITLRIIRRQNSQTFPLQENSCLEKTARTIVVASCPVLGSNSPISTLPIENVCFNSLIRWVIPEIPSNSL